MSWKIGVPIWFALIMVDSAVRPDGCGGWIAASLFHSMAVSGSGFVLGLVLFRDEIRRGTQA